MAYRNIEDIQELTEEQVQKLLDNASSGIDLFAWNNHSKARLETIIGIIHWRTGTNVSYLVKHDTLLLPFEACDHVGILKKNINKFNLE